MDAVASTLTPAQASIALRTQGIDIEPAQITVAARQHCWIAFLPAGRIAWFPMNDEGRRRICLERRVLEVLAERCRFQAPRVLVVDPEAGWDVRLLVPGRCEPFSLYRRVCADPALARHVGQAIGRILADQHTGVRQSDVAGWLSNRVSWPMDSDWIRRHLPRQVADLSLREAIDRALRLCETQRVSAEDAVLVHSDLGLHNISMDPVSDDVLGVFDYEDAAWADRHHDFRYLVFDADTTAMLDGALEVYEPIVGCHIDRHRVALYNAACAITFLAYRQDTPPEVRSCGRTLTEDLAWTRCALERLAIDVR